MKYGSAVAMCLALLAGCASSQKTAPDASSPGPSAKPSEPTEPPTQASTAPAEAPVVWPAASDCSGARCFAFDSPKLAMRALLERRDPLIIGFGEAHAPSDFHGATTVARFTDELLPVLAPRGSALLVELLAPPAGGCEEARAAAQQESNEITTGQSASNQNEYLALGNQARALGLVPDILRASCADMEAIRAAGEMGVVVIMETIARLTSLAVESRRARAPADRPLVFAYGGALHNDLTPREERTTWSYGPPLSRSSGGRYLEVDLLVPGLVPSGHSYAWSAPYEWTQSAPASTWLVEVGEASWALVFPRAPASATP
ncbi:MAG TPA: hypothetical protein VLC09_01895 [Polyangiaceae bacterium]|nr:hypothetical protein [Polyangiaceae bacterium]